jgi:hypothetical protein
MTDADDVIRKLRALAAAMPTKEQHEASVRRDIEEWFGVTPQFDVHGDIWVTRDQWNVMVAKAEASTTDVPSAGRSYNAAVGIPVHIVGEDDQ